MVEKTYESALLSPTGIYSCTINPPDEGQYFESGDVRVQSFLRNLYKKLVKLNEYCSDYEFYLEVSKGGRLHVHGTLETDNIIEFYLHVPPLLKSMGQYELDTVDDIRTWMSYCTKDELVTDWGRYLRGTVFEYPINNVNVLRYAKEYLHYRSGLMSTVEPRETGLELHGVREHIIVDETSSEEDEVQIRPKVRVRRKTRRSRR